MKKALRSGQEKKKTGLTILRRFTEINKDVFLDFKYEQRSSVIKNPKGDIVFENKEVEVPVGWSQVATDILAQKYFRRTGVPLMNGSTGGENSAKQVVHRLADCWKDRGQQYGYFASKKDADAFYDEVAFMMSLIDIS